MRPSAAARDHAAPGQGAVAGRRRSRSPRWPRGAASWPPPRRAQSPRALQARLLDQPDIIDAVPDGGRVRLVRDAAAGPAGDPARPAPDAIGGGAARTAVEAVAPRFEDGFMMLLRGPGQPASARRRSRLRGRSPRHGDDAVVRVQQLLKRFGAFTAVDRINFEVRRGEIFGLLGPNGAGKTTTFRMLCGLLAPSGGPVARRGRRRARRAGLGPRPARLRGAEVLALRPAERAREPGVLRQRIWSARANAGASASPGRCSSSSSAITLRAPSAQLPGGYKQRLAMAAALLHEPEILFLDEPTSGADPLARRAFWRRITALAEQGVTIIVTTHFMQEAEYCDRVAIMDSGRVLAQGSPAEVRARARSERTSRAEHGRCVHRGGRAVARAAGGRGSRAGRGVKARRR